VTGYTEVARGTLNAARISPRDVLVPAILANAASVVMAHNHPSGAASASIADHAVTAAMRGAARILGLRLADHLIVTPTDHYSFAFRRGLDPDSPEGR